MSDSSKKKKETNTRRFNDRSKSWGWDKDKDYIDGDKYNEWKLIKKSIDGEWWFFKLI